MYKEILVCAAVCGVLVVLGCSPAPPEDGSDPAPSDAAPAETESTTDDTVIDDGGEAFEPAAPVDDVPVDETPEMEVPKEIEITSVDLATEFEADEDAAKEKFKGKTMVLTGTVREVIVDEEDPHLSKAILKSLEKDEFGLTGTQVEVIQLPNEVLKTVKQDQPLSVRGSFFMKIGRTIIVKGEDVVGGATNECRTRATDVDLIRSC